MHELSSKKVCRTDKRLNVRILYVCVCVVWLYLINESMPFYGLIGLFRVTGIKEARGAQQRNVERNRH